MTDDGCGGMGYLPITSEADCLSAGADGDLFNAAGVVSPDQGAIIVEGSQDPGTITQGSQRECIVLHNPDSPSTSYLYLAELELVSCGGTVTSELWRRCTLLDSCPGDHKKLMSVDAYPDRIPS